MARDIDTVEQTSPAYSLTHALRHVLNQSGDDVGVDELHAALGLGLLVCAVPEVVVPAAWCAYARDAFLVDTGRLFGATIRPIHPPAAARGLSGRAEFRQHFDASYRPLVLRALEHGQPVLAWGGWSEPHAHHWGIISDTADGGLGLSGSVILDDNAPASGAPSQTAALLIQSPPAQLYVVESTSPERPDSAAFVQATVTHTHAALCGVLDEAFGVITGSAAIAEWQRYIGAPFPSEEAAMALSGMIATSARSLQNTLEREKLSDDDTDVSRLLTTCRALVAAMEHPDSDTHAAAESAKNILEQLTIAI